MQQTAAKHRGRPLRTSRRPLLDQLVGQQADSQKVHALRQDEQGIVVLHHKPQQQEGLGRGRGGRGACGTGASTALGTRHPLPEAQMRQRMPHATPDRTAMPATTPRMSFSFWLRALSHLRTAIGRMMEPRGTGTPVTAEGRHRRSRTCSRPAPGPWPPCRHIYHPAVCQAAAGPRGRAPERAHQSWGHREPRQSRLGAHSPQGEERSRPAGTWGSRTMPPEGRDGHQWRQRRHAATWRRPALVRSVQANEPCRSPSAQMRRT